MQNNIDPVKLASLKIASMSWWDRKWILKRIPKEQQIKVRSAINELSKLGLNNKKEYSVQVLKNLHVNIDQIERKQSSPLDVYITDLFSSPKNERKVAPHSLELLSRLRNSLVKE